MSRKSIMMASMTSYQGPWIIWVSGKVLFIIGS